MLKPLSPVVKINVVLGIMLMLLIGVTGISYIFYGPYYSPDTVNYFNFSNSLFDQSPWTAIYSPFYPFLLLCLSLLPFLSLFRAAHFLILMQYALDIFFLYQLAGISSRYYRFNLENRFIFTLLILVVFHSWWSYRMFTWAHADASFYTLLIAWSYFMAKYQLKESIKSLLISSILAAAMIWVKLNALALIPFFLLLLFIDKNKFKWLIPLFFSVVSYVVYKISFPKNILKSEFPSSSLNHFSLESLVLLWKNLGALFQATLGFFLSDVVTVYVPQLVAGMCGLIFLLSLIYIAFKELKKEVRLSSFFLLSGLVFLLCQLAFQQIIGFEEINYRTLFPFFLGCSWYLWMKLISFGKKRQLPIVALCLMITFHTVAGHLWLWKRQDVNSLFEVEMILKTPLIEHVRTLRQGHFKNAILISNHPEKLALLLNDPYVIPYDPDFQFINGKRRPINLHERQVKLKEHLQKLVKGKALLILFDGDNPFPDLHYENKLLRLNYPEGTIFLKPMNTEPTGIVNYNKHP